LEPAETPRAVEASTNVLSNGRAVLVGQTKQKRIMGEGGIKRDAETHGKIDPVGEQKKGGSQPNPRRRRWPRGSERNASCIVWSDQGDLRTRGGDPERVGGQILGGNIVQVGQDADHKACLEAMIKLVDGVPCHAPGVQQGRGRAETSIAEERCDERIEVAQ